MYHNYLRIISSLKSAAYIANKHPTIVLAMALCLISSCIYAEESPTNSVRDTVICPEYLSQPHQWKLLSPHTKSSDLKFANYPSKRNAAASWVDNSGNFYLFGGDYVPVYPFGPNTTEFPSTTADMWKYSSTTLAWTEILPARYNDPGNTNPAQGAIYPVARFSAMHWKAPDGKLMLFGGQTYELASQGSSAQGPHSLLNDLWSFDSTTNLWSQIHNSSESPNKPSPRSGATIWSHPNGKVYLFGGSTTATEQDPGNLNDFWFYDPATGTWTQISPETTSGIGTTYPANRSLAASWVAPDGSLYLYGGVNTFNTLSDLWKFNILTSTWFKISDKGQYYNGDYTTPDNFYPPSLYDPITWVDSNKFYLTTGRPDSPIPRSLSSIWTFDLTTDKWTFDQLNDAKPPSGNYNWAAQPIYPADRFKTTHAVANNGDIFIFGGFGNTTNFSYSAVNDFWKYTKTSYIASVIDEDTTASFSLQDYASLSETDTFEIVTQPKHGTVIPNGQTFQYVPAANYFGKDEFDIKLKSQDISCVNDTIKNFIFNINPVNDCPVAQPLHIVLNENETTVTILPNRDIDGDPLSYDLHIQNGNLFADMGGWDEQDLEITTRYDFTGTEVFVYSLTDNTCTTTNTLTITVNNDFKDCPEFTGKGKWENIVESYSDLGNLDPSAGPLYPPTYNHVGYWTDSEGNGWVLSEDWIEDDTFVPEPGGNEEPDYINVFIMWKFNTSNQVWNKIDVIRKRNTNPSNGIIQPGLITGSNNWIDKNNNIWMFSGTYYDNDLDDYVDSGELWKFSTSTHDWTLVNSGNHVSSAGNYGTDPALRYPAVRNYGQTWTDQSGNLWLFGGMVWIGNDEYYNDLWMYDPLTNIWHLKGNTTKPRTIGISRPYPRSDGQTWTGLDGNLYLFGGYTSDDVSGTHNDFWKFSIQNNSWTFLGGYLADEIDFLQISNPNFPGPRCDSTGWVDGSGKLFLFSGDSSNGDMYGSRYDLWAYDPQTATWEMYGGSNNAGYRLPQLANWPHTRYSAVSWFDKNENLWLFGDHGGSDTDLWKFTNGLQFSMSGNKNSTIQKQMNYVKDLDDNAVLTIGSQPSHGVASLAINTTNTIVYTPNVNYHGTDNFVLQLQSEGLSCSPKFYPVNVTVANVNTCPTAESKSVTTTANIPLVVNLTVSDSDGDNLSTTVTTPPQHGTTQVDSYNKITYAPATNFSGQDSFTYTLSDGTCQKTGTITVTVNPGPNADVQDWDIY